jgi:uncharacterized 2Fe-2S/4Fe-4S cluster protein (DUF4445 family)
MSELNRCQVEFQPVGKRVPVSKGVTILEAARQAGIELASSCGGEGSCGQCLVVVLSGEVSSPIADEKYMVGAHDLERGYRLACTTQVLGSLKVHLPPGTLISGQRLQLESSLGGIDPDPFVRAYPLHLPPPHLEDLRADLTRLEDALRSQHAIAELKAGRAAIASLPGSLRQNNWRGQAFVRQGEIVAFRPSSDTPLGFAVDLGTTKIAAALIELESGSCLGSGGRPNPQTSYGEDVISRLGFAVRSPEGGQVLAGKVRETLDELLGDLVRQAGAAREAVAEACIVGNSAMIHLLLQLPVRQLAIAPYVAASNSAQDLPAAELGLRMAPGASVHIPPAIGGFVGSDHVAMILASEMDRRETICLGIDIGTNTEISLRLPGEERMTAVSCASGPAFEGAHIRDGMRAASGAIERVRLGQNGPQLTTIENQPAVGLCGSGILDAVAELYRTGCLNAGGRFQSDRAGVRSGELGLEYVLAPSGSSGSGRDIVITQHDVNEILLAKGAIHAGLVILLESQGVPLEAVEEVIVAGAFGTFISIPNSVAMGLFPRLPNARYRQVGNAAALGARWVLISRAARQTALEIAHRTDYLELTTYPKFNRQFALGMRFPERRQP